MRLTPAAATPPGFFMPEPPPMVVKRSPRKRAVPPDAATVAVRDAIRAHVPGAVAELARLALQATSETARVAAINALIDRGYGKLKDTLEGDDGTAAITVRFVQPKDDA